MHYKHGMMKTGEYRSWSHAKTRCFNPRAPKFPIYGGRGITMCEQWRTDFREFFKDMGLRPTPKHTLERKDVNGNYEPNNCVWATNSEQARNRRSSLFVIVDGVKIHACNFAERHGVNLKTLQHRMERGISDPHILRQKILPQPKGEGHKKSKLKLDQVVCIRRDFKVGHSKASIARKYGVSHPCVRAVISRESWK